MHFHRALFVVLSLSLIAVPAAARDRFVDISVFATWVDSSGESALDFDGVSSPADIEFDSDQGFGAAVNVFWSNRVSTEFAISIVDPNLNINDPSRGRIVFSEPLEMMPITAVLQFHLLGASRFDPYVGVGGGYVIFQDIEDPRDLDELDVDAIDFEDDIGLVYNAGVKIGLTQNFGLYLDAKYMPLESAARPVVVGGSAQRVDVAIDPLILAAGISFSF